MDCPFSTANIDPSGSTVGKALRTFKNSSSYVHCLFTVTVIVNVKSILESFPFPDIGCYAD
jgi:hypothetical protein